MMFFLQSIWKVGLIVTSGTASPLRCCRLISLVLLTGSPGLSQSLSLGIDSLRHLEPIRSDIQKQSVLYALKDSSKLGLDIYRTNDSLTTSKKPCVLFVFGGAFMSGRRDDGLYNKFINTLAVHDFIVISMSYRLGLKGVKPPSKFDLAPLERAIAMAVEDVYDATMWVIEHADQLGIDTSRIILSGSSSGAVTVLKADYDQRNRSLAAQKLPIEFTYAGIVAFSGAILSVDGRLKYRQAPAPILLFHGTADKMVPYDQIKFLNRGLFGSASIARTFRENGYPYYMYREEGLGHEVSVLPMIDRLPVILDFLDQFVRQRKAYQIDVSFKDPTAKPLMVLNPKELFRKLAN